MKFSILVASAIFATTASAAPVKRDVPENLIPDFGFSAGRNPTGTGDCDGAVIGGNGQAIKIPCACPPNRGDFVRKLNDNVRAGRATNNPGVAVSFPLGTSKADQLARMQTALVTLQNLNGPGQGCPAVSTTFLVQQKAIADFNGGPPAPAAAPPPPPPPPAPAAQGGVPENLIPDFGFSAGRNPTGTGDCDGAVNGGNGQPIKIPCACPPDRGDFIRKLNDNVRAGRATNNPGVAVSFPLGTSKADQLARMQTALVTLQNLNGPGQGCPAASTTFLAQQKAIADFNGGPPAPAPAPAAPAPAPAPAAPAGNDIASLAPDLGFSAGRNPTGTGDCDGAVIGGNGQPVKIPCACPPSRDDFIAALTANVNAGRPVNNPGIPFSFPRGDSKEDKIARIQAGLVTLQNLNGPGKGCPAAATTLLAQQRALTG